jgi:trehalose/maltose hydrolase-like predicted phosphorylase
MKYLLIISIIVGFITLLRVFRKPIVKWLVKIRASLKIRSLRHAIQEADDNKASTFRKTMVVYNTSSGEYETLEKKILKKASYLNRNKNNAKLTEGRKKFMKKMDSHSDVHIPGIWNKSLKDNPIQLHLQEHEMAFANVISDEAKGVHAKDDVERAWL